MVNLTHTYQRRNTETTQQQVTSKVGHHGHLGVIARLLLALVLKQDTEIAFLPMIVLLEEMKQSHV